MSFILRLPMLSKHSLNPKHSSQQGPNSSGPGASVVANAVPNGLSFLWTLALSLLSRAGLRIPSRSWGCSLPRALQRASKGNLAVSSLRRYASSYPKTFQSLLPGFMARSILSAGNGGGEMVKEIKWLTRLAMW